MTVKAPASYEVVVPLRDFDANSPAHSLLRALGAQEHPPHAVHLVVGDTRQGRAINFGVSRMDAPFMATLDDDTVIDDPRLFRRLAEAFAADPRIGMAGAACEIPAWATPFQCRAMREIRRRHFPRQAATVDSDMVQHPCLMMPREFFLALGGEDEDLIRGLDPVLRKKVRDAGRRCNVVADTWVYHLLPGTLGALLAMYYRNGRGSGYAQRHHPERVLELTDGDEGGGFIERRPLPYRAARRLTGLCAALGRGCWLRAATDCAYAAGVLRARLFPEARTLPRPVGEIASGELRGHPFPVLLHRVRLGTPAP